MFRNILKLSKFTLPYTLRKIIQIPYKCRSLHTTLSLPLIGLNFVRCEEKKHDFSMNYDSLEHDFFIKQSCTTSVTSAIQMLTVTIIAIQDMNYRLREALSSEIILIRQALEWGETATPDEHYDALVAVRSTLIDLKHNLETLNSYLDYAQRLATLSAEVSFFSGNIGASDIVSEHMNYVDRAYRIEREQTEILQIENLKWQKLAIESSKMKEALESSDIDKHKTQHA